MISTSSCQLDSNHQHPAYYAQAFISLKGEKMNVQIMSLISAEYMSRHYVCSRCLGKLLIKTIKNSPFVLLTCQNCGDGYGFAPIRDKAAQVEANGKSQCPHTKRFIHTSGGQHYDGNEYWDDIEDHLMCAECKEEINE